MKQALPILLLLLSLFAAASVNSPEDISVENPVDENFGGGSVLDETIIEFQFEADPEADGKVSLYRKAEDSKTFSEEVGYVQIKDEYSETVLGSY